MENTMRLAVPSNSPGGLEAGRSDHFGHCDIFTVIDIDSGSVKDVATVANQAHDAGGCMVPVQLLKDNGVDAIVVGGIGARPLQGFNEVGIAVYFADRNLAQDVQAVINGMVAGKFPLIRSDQTCQGGSNCHN
jgi:predicted Fe-Mo cluster-binding NifX family protein